MLPCSCRKLRPPLRDQPRQRASFSTESMSRQVRMQVSICGHVAFSCALQSSMHAMSVSRGPCRHELTVLDHSHDHISRCRGIPISACCRHGTRAFNQPADKSASVRVSQIFHQDILRNDRRMPASRDQPQAGLGRAGRGRA